MEQVGHRLGNSLEGHGQLADSCHHLGDAVQGRHLVDPLLQGFLRPESLGDPAWPFGDGVE